MRQYDQAIEQLRKTLELDQNFVSAHLFLAITYEGMNEFSAAIAEMNRARLLDDTPWHLAELGYAYAAAGKREEAQRVITELQELAQRRYVSPFDIATIYAGLGERDQAFAWLERAYEDRSVWMVYLKTLPRFDSLRSDPRFTDLLRRMGIPS
jgi:tetratricopeptide (TPR) repeat protein